MDQVYKEWYLLGSRADGGEGDGGGDGEDTVEGDGGGDGEGTGEGDDGGDGEEGQLYAFHPDMTHTPGDLPLCLLWSVMAWVFGRASLGAQYGAILNERKEKEGGGGLELSTLGVNDTQVNWPWGKLALPDIGAQEIGARRQWLLWRIGF
jgi:hypothetical protein